MGYLATYTGRIFNYNNINKDSINIDDIFRSLPRLNRFVGHSSRPYSVGEHSINCFILAEELGFSVREQLLVFIHDFTEAYVGDCPAPLKDLLPDFSRIEDMVETAIYEYMDIKPPTEDERKIIKMIDKTMLVIEMRDLTLHKHGEFIDENVYESVIKDGNISIVGKDMSSNFLSEEKTCRLLHFIFNELTEKYKNEV